MTIPRQLCPLRWLVCILFKPALAILIYERAELGISVLWEVDCAYACSRADFLKALPVEFAQRRVFMMPRLFCPERCAQHD
jgi:hypothetical protein